ncbi:N-methyl-L-tryptophan oxidase [Streptomyces sp. NPDC002896]|uniref:N-methyl-L-tryptophan oxidase n=1 Tax=Streptomyces sp. NPDC002896 TaxID=3154438 RepID=UPI00332DBDFB
MIDVLALRAASPGCATGHHHLNAAGAALPAARTVETVVAHLRREAQIGGYEAAKEAKARLDEVYRLAAAVLGAEPGEIALVESSTAGWQRAVQALRLGAGDRVLAARSSYVSNALHLLALERDDGVRIEVLDNGPDGAVDLAALERSLRAGPTALVTASHVPTSSGLVEPAAGIGALCREHGVPFLLDATQSVGQFPVDVARIGCDLLVTTGRKFLRGPRGTGLLYVRRDLLKRLEPVAPDVRGAHWDEHGWTLSPDATRFELWEAAHALRLGLGTALEQLQDLGTDRVAARLDALGRSMRATLGDIPGVRLTDPPAAAGSIVTFTVESRTAPEVQAELARRRVHLVSVPAGHGRWDLGARGLDAVVRASAHVYNDDDDIQALGAAVREVTATGRRSRSRRAVADEETGVVVVGLGAHGSAALHHLARQGIPAIGLEQFTLGHDRGSSHGATRMIRRAYPDPVWDPFVDAAYTGWAELAEESGQRLVTRTGGLFAHPSGTPGGLRGPSCIEVDAVEASLRAPGLRIPEGYGAVYDPDAGVIDAEGALRAQLALARAAGAQVRDGEPVKGFEPDGSGVVVTTAHGRIRAERLVLCAGPWTGRLLPRLAPALRVTRIVNAYFEAADDGPLAPPGLGVFSLELPQGLVYGIPALGGQGLKVGLDSGDACDPDAPRRPAQPDELALLTDAVRRHLPAAGALRSHLTCLYTMTDDRRFVLGPLSDLPQVVVASACSGHGFKFTPAIGAALADLARGLPRPDLDFLAPARLLESL